MIFLDSSLVVRRYLRERDHDLLENRLGKGESVFLSELVRVEFPSAVWRRSRGGSLERERARLVLAEFSSDREQYGFVPVSPGVLDRAAALLERHALRSLDAIQLASAQVAAEGSPEPMRFGSADARLNAAAKAEGLALLLEE